MQTYFDIHVRGSFKISVFEVSKACCIKGNIHMEVRGFEDYIVIKSSRLGKASNKITGGGGEGALTSLRSTNPCPWFCLGVCLL